MACVMVEVDDLMLAGSRATLNGLKEQLTARFQFRKWQSNDADYAGRHIRVLPDRVEVDQEKYILEEVQAVPLPRHRRATKTSPLTPEEFKAFRSLIYKVNWLARESRPESSGTAFHFGLIPPDDRHGGGRVLP